MLKRLLYGWLKGLVIGGAIGAGIQYGLPEIEMTWPIVSGGIAGYLLTMGAAGTTGVFAGKPPWREGAWIEALLKGLVGGAAGALLYWLGSRYGTFAMPFPGVEGTTVWTAEPVLFLPAIAGAYGSLVELDNTGDDDKKRGRPSKSGPKVRVAADADHDIALGDTEHAESTKPAKRRA
jgi:hypothetical protein